MKIHKKFTYKSANSGNFIFEGNNFDSMRLLLCTHYGSVDCIYIDPPYNTGSRHFVYKDSFGGSEGLGSEWANFMRPRLEMAKSLLKDSGSIFISIDNNEIGALLILCDSIFGKSNRIGIFCKTIQGGKNDSKFVKTSHEYLIVYGKTKRAIEQLRRRETNSAVKTDQQLNKWGDNDRRSDRPNLYYPIFVSPDLSRISTSKFPGAQAILPIKSNGEDGCWRWGREKVEREKDRLIVKPRGSGKLGIYVRGGHSTDSTTPWSSVIDQFPSGGGTLIKEMFGDAKVFNYAKNLEYIKWIVSLLRNKNAVVLDFFAGSGTTAHAVLDLNRTDGGDRKFILCGNREATKEHPKKNICLDVCAERIKKVIGREPPLLGSAGFDYFVVETPGAITSRQIESTVRSIAQIKYDLVDGPINRRAELILDRNELIYLGQNSKGTVYLMAPNQSKPKIDGNIRAAVGKGGDVRVLKPNDVWSDEVIMGQNVPEKGAA